MNTSLVCHAILYDRYTWYNPLRRYKQGQRKLMLRHLASLSTTKREILDVEDITEKEKEERLWNILPRANARVELRELQKGLKILRPAKQGSEAR